MNKNDQNYMAQKIRSQYIKKEGNGLEALKKLDQKVKRPAQVFAYVFGGIGAVVMGSGMSLVMTDIGATIGLQDPLVPGIVIGIAGLAIAAVNYPLYRGILHGRKRKYADQILKLSDTIMQDN